jgi:integrase
MSRRRLQLKGNLYVDGNWWRLRWWEEARAADGSIKRIRRSAVVGPATGAGRLSKKEAQRQAWDNILSHVNAAVSTPASLITVEQFINQKFIPEVVWALKHGTQKHYEYCFSKIVPGLGNLSLRDLTVSVVQKFLRELVDGGFSSQTVYHCKNAVSALVSHAKRIGYYTGENPASLVRLPPLTRVKEKRALTIEQAQVVLEKLEEPLRTMVLMSLTTSLNVAELCGLTWKYVNLSDKPVLVDGEMIPPWSFAVRKNFYKGKLEASPKTKKRNRTQPIPVVLQNALSALRGQSKFVDSDDFVFACATGNPVDGHNANNRQFKKLSEELGVPISWHIFRHTCATLSEAAGMPRSDRISLMGHAGGEMTDYYTHSDIERRRGFLDGIASKLTQKEQKEVDELERMVGLREEGIE